MVGAAGLGAVVAGGGVAGAPGGGGWGERGLKAPEPGRRGWEGSAPAAGACGRALRASPWFLPPPALRLCALRSLPLAVNVLPTNSEGISAKQRGKGSCPRPGRAARGGRGGSGHRRGRTRGPGGGCRGARPAAARSPGAPGAPPALLPPPPPPARPRPGSAPPLARGPRLRLRSPKDKAAPGFWSAGRPKGTAPRASRSPERRPPRDVSAPPTRGPRSTPRPAVSARARAGGGERGLGAGFPGPQPRGAGGDVARAPPPSAGTARSHLVLPFSLRTTYRSPGRRRRAPRPRPPTAQVPGAGWGVSSCHPARGGGPVLPGGDAVMVDALGGWAGGGAFRARERPPPPAPHPGPVILRRGAGGGCAPAPEKGRGLRVRQEAGAPDRGFSLPGPRPRTSAHNPRAFPRPARSMLPAAMKSLGLALLAVLLCSAPGESGGGPRGWARSPEEPEAAPERAGLRGRHPPTVPVTSTPSPGPRACRLHSWCPSSSPSHVGPSRLLRAPSDFRPPIPTGQPAAASPAQMPLAGAGGGVLAPHQPPRAPPGLASRLCGPSFLGPNQSPRGGLGMGRSVQESPGVGVVWLECEHTCDRGHGGCPGLPEFQWGDPPNCREGIEVLPGLDLWASLACSLLAGGA